MKRVLETGWLPLLVAAILVASLPAPMHAGLGDKLKKKAEDKANKEADKAINQTEEDASKKADGEKSESSEEKSEAAPKGSGDVASVSTKFDFVPGDKVLFYDDFSQDELGEFPVHWTLRQGTLEVAEMKGQRWLRSTSTTSGFAMKAPAMPELPEFWTLELDWYCGEPSGNVLTVTGQKADKTVWEAIFPYSGERLYFGTGKITSDTPIEGGASKVWGVVHHVMFMARGKALKVYVDSQRLANVPEIDPANGSPDNIDITLWSDKEPMITNVRFAEGNKPVADPFADGKLVTYGIYFDSGSDVVKPESAPVLRQIAAYMEKNAAVKVQIVGHTDNQGTADGNLDLSKRRSASVAKVLSTQFKLAADRFQTDGKGNTVPISKNDTSEGRAANRRVEFSKI